MRELPGHDTSVCELTIPVSHQRFDYTTIVMLTPVSSGPRLGSTLSESTRLDVSIGCVSWGSRFANDDLVRLDGTVGELKDGRAGEVGGGSYEVLAGGVGRCTLVVVLDVVPINQGTDLAVDCGVGLRVSCGREPMVMLYMYC
jgi:hypothetical protein